MANDLQCPQTAATSYLVAATFLSTVSSPKAAFNNCLNGVEVFVERHFEAGKNFYEDLTFLESLRIVLASSPLPWVKEFDLRGGWEALVAGMLAALRHPFSPLKSSKNPQEDGQFSGSNECGVEWRLMQCWRAFCNNKYGVERVRGVGEDCKGADGQAMLAIALYASSEKTH